MEKKHLKFKKKMDGELYEVYNTKGDFLGHICKEKDWNKLCFYPDDSTFYSQSCLQEIIDFMLNLSSKG